MCQFMLQRALVVVIFSVVSSSLVITATGTYGAESTGLIPITDMNDQLYKGYSGGLYGQSSNEPPEKHLALAQIESSIIEPLDENGQPSPTGKIVLMSLGMSNTTQEFSAFKKLADADPNKSPNVIIVDCAQGGQAAYEWAHADANNTSRTSPWTVMDQRLEKADIKPTQVQVVWMKQAQKRPAGLGEFPKHTQNLRDDMAVILKLLKARFPNLRIAYLSSRIYAGYATTDLNPEPYAYESAFSVRWLIEDQINGDPNLNCDPSKGMVQAPLLLWGPYLWADGIKGRGIDNLSWFREDFAADGTHPSPSGRQKVAEMLLTFFASDLNAKKWFSR